MVYLTFVHNQTHEKLDLKIIVSNDVIEVDELTYDDDDVAYDEILIHDNKLLK